MSKIITVLLLVGVGISLSYGCFSSGPHPEADMWMEITNSGQFLMTVAVESREGEDSVQQLPRGETRRWDLYLKDDQRCSKSGCASGYSSPWTCTVKATYKDPSLSYGGLYQALYTVRCGMTEVVELNDCPGWSY